MGCGDCKGCDCGDKLWSRVYVDGWKTHWCPTALVPDLLEEAFQRGAGFNTTEASTHILMDLPGMIASGRHLETLEVAGLRIDIPSTDFEIFYLEVKHSPLRKFASGRGYYKVHAYMSCLVLTPAQHSRLLQEMGFRLAEACDRGRHERGTLVEALQDCQGVVSEKVVGKKVAQLALLAENKERN